MEEKGLEEIGLPGQPAQKVEGRIGGRWKECPTVKEPTNLCLLLQRELKEGSWWW